MLATILKSPQAINTTIAIIDTFTQFKNLTGTVYEMAKAKDDSKKVEIFERSTNIITNILDNELIVSQQETSFKLKLPFFEVTRKVTKVKNGFVNSNWRIIKIDFHIHTVAIPRDSYFEFNSKYFWFSKYILFIGLHAL